MSASDASSNLLKVSSEGSTSPVVTSGSTTFDKVLIAPTGKIYTVFKSSVNLEDTTVYGDCLLAEVNKDTGVPTCLEHQSEATIPSNPKPSNPAVQFDSAGAVYFYILGRQGHSVVRLKDGVRTELIQPGEDIMDYLVLPDGQVVIRGHTFATTEKWIRVLNSDGTPYDTYHNYDCGFLRRFPDGNVYFGCAHGLVIALFRYITSTRVMDSEPYIGWDSDWSGHPLYPLNPYCSGYIPPPGLCGPLGSAFRDMATTTSQRVYVAAGFNTEGMLTQYYPTLAVPTTAVKKISVTTAVGNQIALAGLNADGANILMLFNTEDDTEVQLIGPDNEIEIFRISYVVASNSLMFDGLRKADNKYVIGLLNLGTLALNVTVTGTEKLLDLQGF